MEEKRKVIIDCDPGIDDSLAIMLALSSRELEVLGITIVYGNVPTKLGAENALKVLKFMDRLDIPVYLGQDKPLSREYISAQDTHGMDGLGETNYPLVKDIRPKDGAVDFIIETLNKNKDVSIIALGPLGNIARAIEKDKNVFNNLDEFVTMGGSFKSHGNCSPVAEYNYWCDPHAAKFVYENLGKTIHMVGLDVTRSIVLSPNIVEYIQNLDQKKGKFIKDITRFYFDFHWEYEKVIGCVVNDPLAVAYFINRKLCSGFSTFTTVETEGISIGQTVVDSMNFWKRESNSYVLTEVDHIKFMNMFLSRIFCVNEDEIKPVLDQIMK
ncbi:nucleoside hydrolase [Alkaliphilus sp. B6464]|uniref:nucleoside hydrolase n=1 Tax=Alkaliphilus sp. B6464 TaxID=2731219 RepID=UPI001BA70546|nr:nucleoside hydrolase [Alkaliphilus sp. B6464]QUH20642.1 nucleoside hydrolase [Alkaliphilus sp. B6464]